MNTIKVNLHIELPGRTLDNSGKYTTKMQKRLKDTKSNKYYFAETELRNTIPASQEIKWTQSQYLYMTSKQGCPDDFNKFVWNKLTPKERIKIHAEYFCKSINGTSFQLEVL